MTLFFKPNAVAFLHFYKVVAAIVIILASLIACDSEARIRSGDSTSADSSESGSIYQALLAELYNQLGDEKLAVTHYQQLLSQNKDPLVAKRVTEIAATTGQLSKGIEAARFWVDLREDNIEARQYLALLLLRSNEVDLSVEQFHIIRKRVDQDATGETKSDKSKDIKTTTTTTTTESKGLKFIGSMLALESHHDKALLIFERYLEKYADGYEGDSGLKYKKIQQQLIMATLASNTKQYDVVIKNLGSLESLETTYQIKAASMKAKALKALKRPQQAIKTLNLIIDYKETPDSDRLELVRLMVLNHQKDQALVVLQSLVDKHQANNELLKALIALQIDQSLLDKAYENITTLHLSEAYRFDAEYLYGEIHEAGKNQALALDSYNKVKGGTFLKNAQGKAIRLTKKLKGRVALEELFKDNLKIANTDKGKSYWIKQQADLQFDNNEYIQAMELYDKAIALSPENTVYRYQRGLLNEKMGQLDLAEKDFNYVLDRKKNDAVTLNALGFMLIVHTKRFDEAKEYIKQAHRINPDDPVIMDSLGWAHYKTGDLSNAVNYLSKAFNKLKNLEVASHLIQALVESGEEEAAENIYTEMSEKYPDSRILNNVKHFLPGI